MEGLEQCIFFCQIFAKWWPQKKTPSVKLYKFFSIEKYKKNRHLLREKIHMSPYLDNEFLEVAKIR